MEVTGGVDGVYSHEEPLLQNIITDKYIQGMVNYKGEKFTMNNGEFGGWKSASRVLVIDCVDAFVFFGILSNLISYLTNQFGQSTATAAQNVNIWVGVVFMLPLLIGFVADSYLGRFRIVLVSSCFCILRFAFFFFSLYLVAIGAAGFATCAPAFGADQFDGQNPNEIKSKSSFFNWWQIGISVGGTAANTILNYIQDNLGWGLGFGILCISTAVALIVFLSGIKTYRYSVIDEARENPLLGVTEVLVADAKNWRITSSSNTSKDEAVEAFAGNSNAKVEEANSLLRLFPLWIICLIYPVVIAQNMTLFTKQSSTMDRSIGLKFQIPAASLQLFIGLSIILFAAVYDRLFVPLARVFTGRPNGITMLQRIGTGIFFTAISMVIAAVVEDKRLKTAIDFGLLDPPNKTVPMSVWWLIPQYVVSGLAIAFTSIGLQEFFYDQVPNGLKSMGLALNTSVFGVGNFASGFLISTVQKVTSADGQYGWFADNLNRAHLDYFYWLLAGLSTLELFAFLCYSKTYLYRREASI
ncbi:protein NRT1/ PTR FAMILY 5.10-like [Papaver somniferum]|uniref:protein NRT1/ PTR FAMILY 5.10-like n=1 Tax=Papaver somniferum TaxID=3469 RepID=UPI000E6F5805|nr:protein NRT1/ PTR FAMILY 5.10-like [Papaver somniferum]